MKVFAIGRNYSDHARELNNPVPESPIVFMKPQTALIINNLPFSYPPFSKDIHYEVELVIKINKNGKGISKSKASGFFDEIAIGIDFTARDIQQACKEKGLPWEIAKAFDGSAPLSDFIPKDQLPENISFELFKNKLLVQSGNSRYMIFSTAEIISYLSGFFTLEKGDLIYTGTPKGVGSVQKGEILEAKIEGKKLLECEII